MRKKTYYWYVEPLDPQTNELVAAYLSVEGNDTFDNFSGITDAQGNIHQVWQVKPRHIEALRRSRPKNSWLINFRVWKRDTNYGVLRRCEFMEHPKRRYSPAKTKPRKK